MKKLIALLTLVVSLSANTQTLFYYANDSVSAKEFLRAYQKNNTATKNSSSLATYLDLYIASRLKIAEAKKLGYDTLPQMVADLDNLRQQILPNYLSDKESLNKLVKEALFRKQKDVRLAHIFIATKNATVDELTAAAKKSVDVVAAIKAGEDFAALAKKYSDDPAAATNGGNLGWITVFSLPYELENLAYTTPVGKTSVPHRSKAGYHIFKNLGERKAVGRMKAAQILLAFLPGSSEAEKLMLKKRADSIYNRIVKGADFGKLATQFSNDVVSSAANGMM
ncbi:MAG: peptidylprolyl isomerase, partial [Bacteroidota bacterium]